MHDLTTALVIHHVLRGRSMVYCDFVAYDEVAHHAGPERAESLDRLTDIGKHLALIERAIGHARRHYQVVVLSDHGQALGAPFHRQHGMRLEELVRSLLPRSSVVHAEGWKSRKLGPT